MLAVSYGFLMMSVLVNHPVASDDALACKLAPNNTGTTLLQRATVYKEASGMSGGGTSEDGSEAGEEARAHGEDDPKFVLPERKPRGPEEYGEPLAGWEVALEDTLCGFHSVEHYLRMALDDSVGDEDLIKKALADGCDDGDLTCCMKNIELANMPVLSWYRYNGALEGGDGNHWMCIASKDCPTHPGQQVPGFAAPAGPSSAKVYTQTGSLPGKEAAPTASPPPESTCSGKKNKHDTFCSDNCKKTKKCKNDKQKAVCDTKCTGCVCNSREEPENPPESTCSGKKNQI